MNTPLVTTAWLEEHLEDPDVRVFDVCNVPDNTAYRRGHIPGATWWYWKDLCWHETDREFITSEAAARLLGAAGVGPQTTLVFSGDPVQFGTYAFWAFTMAGHIDVRLLDGAGTKWLAEGRPLTIDIPRFSAVAYEPRPGDTTMRLGRDDVREKLGEPGRLLLDVRTPEEYSGERVAGYPDPDHGAERKGRIPGAVHLYFRDLLNDDDTFKSADDLWAAFGRLGIGPADPRELVVYCRLSHRASLTWVALRYLLGHENVRMYDGSWTEWGSIVGFPVEK